jgi:hypothetical protein
MSHNSIEFGILARAKLAQPSIIDRSSNFRRILPPLEDGGSNVTSERIVLRVGSMVHFLS